MKVIIVSFFLFSIFLSFPATYSLSNPDYIQEISPKSYYTIYVDLTPGDIIYIEFEVTSGGNKDIDVYILDETNYNKFDNDESFFYYKFLDHYTSGSFEYTSQKTDRFYLVFDNSFSLITKKTVEFNFDDTSTYSGNENEETTNNDEEESITNDDIILYSLSFIGIVLFLGMVVGAINMRSKVMKKEKKDKENVKETIIIKESNEPKLKIKEYTCPNCGGKIDITQTKNKTLKCEHCEKNMLFLT